MKRASAPLGTAQGERLRNVGEHERGTFGIAVVGEGRRLRRPLRRGSQLLPFEVGEPDAGRDTAVRARGKEWRWRVVALGRVVRAARPEGATVGEIPRIGRL